MATRSLLFSFVCSLFQGKFGGLQNKAPPLERMRGAVFAAPLPLAFHSLTTQIGEYFDSKAIICKIAVNQAASSTVKCNVARGNRPFPSSLVPLFQKHVL